MSPQTESAKRVARSAEVQMLRHVKTCATCRTARFDVDYCLAGWNLRNAAVTARETARRSAELDRAVPDGQEAMF